LSNRTYAVPQEIYHLQLAQIINYKSM